VAGAIADFSARGPGLIFQPSAMFDASSLTLNSGQVSILMQPQAGPLTGSVVSPHLVLEGSLLQRIQQVDRLTIGSYRSIDIYGAGSFGSSSLRELRFRAGGDSPSTVQVESGIRAYNQGAGTALVRCQFHCFREPLRLYRIGRTSPSPLRNIWPMREPSRSGPIILGIAGYGQTTLSARNGVSTQSSGTFAATGAMDIMTPIVAGGSGSSQGITAAGNSASSRMEEPLLSPAVWGLACRFRERRFP